MPFSATIYQIMIASPGDVFPERDVVRDLLHEWNNLYAQKERIVLLPVGWETHSAPSMEATAQEIINRQVLQRCDILIGIFWTRIGTPTNEAISGTVEEIEKHLASGRHALLYFSDAPIQPSKLNAQQYAGVLQFRQECQKRGLYATYDSLDSFREQLRKHLSLTIQQQPLFHTNDSAAVEATAPTAQQPSSHQTSEQTTLSQEARELLVEAVESNQPIFKRRTVGGLKIAVGEKQFGVDKRSIALWEGAVQELVAEELLTAVGHTGVAFDVTAKGYRLAETLIPLKAKGLPLTDGA